MYQYENKPKKKIQNYNPCFHSPVIQKYAPFAVGGQIVAVNSASITMGDNDQTFGHNCILIEKLEPNRSPDRPHPYELKRTCFVAHLVPKSDVSHNQLQKIIGVPGIVKHTIREEYYASDANLNEGDYVGPPDQEMRPQDYFNQNYRKRVSFHITLANANAAIAKVLGDVGQVTYRWLGGGLGNNTYNCATWAASVMNAAGVPVPYQVVPHNLMESAKGLADASGPLGQYHELDNPQQN